MRRGIWLLLVCVMAGMTSVQAGTSKEEIAAAYENKGAVIKDALYSIIYPRPNGLGTGDTRPTTTPITVVSPDGQVFYSADFQNLGGEATARDPQQLADIVSSRTGNGGGLMTRMMTSSKENNDTDKVREARLLKFNSGTTVTVKDVKVDEKKRRLTLKLCDEIDKRCSSPTGLTVEWAGELTREGINAQVARFLDIK
jgi:hypothetical protein